MCLGKDSASDLLRFCGEDLVASELETVLGKQIDSKLNFENHIKSLCNKATQKLATAHLFGCFAQENQIL